MASSKKPNGLHLAPATPFEDWYETTGWMPTISTADRIRIRDEIDVLKHRLIHLQKVVEDADKLWARYHAAKAAWKRLGGSFRKAEKTRNSRRT